MKKKSQIEKDLDLIDKAIGEARLESYKDGFEEGKKQALTSEINWLENLHKNESCYCSDYNPKCQVCKINERIAELKGALE